MTLVVGTNTYIDQADADAYFATRYNSSAWSVLDAPTKEVLLVSATRALDYYSTWAGQKTDPNQALQFPRYPDTEVPDDIPIAQCEIAMSIFENDTTVDEVDQSLKELKVDVVQFKFNDTSNNSTIYNSFVEAILKQYISAYGSNKLTRV